MPPPDPLLAADYSFTVVGTPQPQGSKTRFRKRVVDDNAERLAPWRDSIIAVASQVRPRTPIHDPVYVNLVATFIRPRSHYGTGRNFEVLKASAPGWHAQKPDGDKVARAAFDSLVIARLLVDDALVTEHHMFKRWAGLGESPHLDVEIWLL